MSKSPFLKSTRYKNKWPTTIFETEMSMKRAILEPVGVFKSYDIKQETH